jgi:hypothetical protein
VFVTTNDDTMSGAFAFNNNGTFAKAPNGQG